MEKPCRKLTKIIKKSMKIHQNSPKIEVRRGPGASWEGSWAHSGAQGCPMDENDAKREMRFPSPGTELETKIHTFPTFWHLFLHLFSEGCLGRLPAGVDFCSIFHRFWTHFGGPGGSKSGQTAIRKPIKKKVNKKVTRVDASKPRRIEILGGGSL